MFYSHDGFGLGHIRRTLAIAGELGRRRPDAALLALTGSLEAHAFELPRNFDYIKLPSVTKDRRGAYASRTLPIPIDHASSLRERVIREAAQTFHPDLVVVDHTPVGLRGELVRTLSDLRASHAKARLVLGLRDIIDEPAAVRASWVKEGVYDLLDSSYDRILIYGSRQVFDPIHAYGFSPTAAAKTVFCGYIQKPEPILEPARIRAKLGAGTRPLAVLTVGGGGDGGRLIRAYLAGLRASRDRDIVSCIITGPLLDEYERAQVYVAADGVPNVVILPFSKYLISYLNAADVVVTMGGYNTVCETVALGKRVVIVPRIHPRQEQLIRARRLAQIGAATMLHPDDLTPDRLRTVVREALAGPPPRPILDFGGLRRAGAALVEALDDARTIEWARMAGDD